MSTYIVQTTGTVLNVMTVLERVRTGLLKEKIIFPLLFFYNGTEVRYGSGFCANSRNLNTYCANDRYHPKCHDCAGTGPNRITKRKNYLFLSSFFYNGTGYGTDPASVLTAGTLTYTVNKPPYCMKKNLCIYFYTCILLGFDLSAV